MIKENVPQVNEICRISRNAEVSGDLISSSDIRIDGKFVGKIHTKGKLVIGESAFVEGKMVCQSADIWGDVKGDIFVEDSLTLKAPGKFNGQLKSSKICIEMGAVINGPCNIIAQEEFKKLSGEIFPEKKSMTEKSVSK